MSCKDCNSNGCCSVNLSIDPKVLEFPNKILLMGNPNVGKSVIFSALTGIYAMSSNYAGTTVSYTKGKMNINEQEFQLIDVPGTYSLSATSEAEQVAVNFMNSNAKVVVCVLDATNLTRNLSLALEIKKYGVPVVFALNLVDIANRKGIEIDVDALSKALNAPVVNTVAVKKEGLEELKTKILEVIDTTVQKDESVDTTKELWLKSEKISNNVTIKKEQNLKKIDKLGERLLKPWPGIPLTLLIVIISLCIIVFGGKGVRALITSPIVNNCIIPFFQWLVGLISMPETLSNILVGEYGVFVIGFQWPIDFILPFVLMFYIVFTFLEDCGFLPRMAVLYDNIMRKMGVQGGSLISLLMGYGCAVPAIIGTRNATTRKERIIITAMVCFAVPCISQLGALVTLCTQTPVFENGEAVYVDGVLQTVFNPSGILLLIGLFLISFLVLFLIGFIVGKLLKGKIDPIVIEVPNLLVPEKKSYFKKLMIRMKNFLVEAEIPMLLAVVIIALFAETGLLDLVANACSPVVSGMLGLPKEAASGLILGVIRREFAVLPLLAFNLTSLQVIVAGVVSLLYLPCISVFGVIAKELKARVAIAIGVGTFATAILLGTLINLIGQLFM